MCATGCGLGLVAFWMLHSLNSHAGLMVQTTHRFAWGNDFFFFFLNIHKWQVLGLFRSRVQLDSPPTRHSSQLDWALETHSLMISGIFISC